MSIPQLQAATAAVLTLPVLGVNPIPWLFGQNLGTDRTATCVVAAYSKQRGLWQHSIDHGPRIDQNHFFLMIFLQKFPWTAEIRQAFNPSLSPM
jgi:hypothetical protein